MSDIVERLRDHAEARNFTDYEVDCAEAADEIERLRRACDIAVYGWSNPGLAGCMEGDDIDACCLCPACENAIREAWNGGMYVVNDDD